MAAVPVLLRSGVRRASRQRRADDPGQAPLEAVSSRLPTRSRPGSGRRPALDESLHRSHRLTGVESRPSVGAEGNGRLLVRDRRTPHEDRYSWRHAAHGADHLDDRLSSGTVAPTSTATRRTATRAAPAKDSAGVLAPRSTTSNRAARSSSATIALGQRMQIAGRRPQHHSPSPPPPAGEHGPQPTDDALRDHRRPVLVGDAELARRPAVTDRSHRRRQQIDMDAGRLGARSQGGLDQRPHPGFITGHKAIRHLIDGPASRPAPGPPTAGLDRRRDRPR